MKIKELAKCARADGLMTLLDETDEDGLVVRQYVMLPERAIFPLDGMPIMSDEQLLRIMDVPEEKRSAYSVTRVQINERLRAMMEDSTEEDREAKPCWASLTMNGMTVNPVFTLMGTSRIGFVESELYRVVADLRGLDMYERTVDGQRVYVLMHGFVNVGCIMPTMEHWTKSNAEELAAVGVEARRVYNAWEQEHGADQ